MDDPRWERIEEIFHQAVTLPELERRPFVERACDGDEELLAQVWALVAEDGEGSTIVDSGLAGIAARMLDQPEHIQGTFGLYRIEKTVGEGGMGIVYRAQDKITGKSAAIKILRDAHLSPSRRERFDSEQKLPAGLQHPYIAELHN